MALISLMPLLLRKLHPFVWCVFENRLESTRSAIHHWLAMCVCARMCVVCSGIVFVREACSCEIQDIGYSLVTNSEQGSSDRGLRERHISSNCPLECSYLDRLEAAS